MAKITIADLKRIKEEVSANTCLREGRAKVKVIVHLGTCGLAKGARALLHAATEELAKSGRHDVAILTCGCKGACGDEPLVSVELAGAAPVDYGQVDEAKMRQIFQRHALAGEVQGQWVLAAAGQQQ